MLGFLPTCWWLFVRRHIFCQRQYTLGLYIIFDQLLLICRYLLSAGTLCLPIRFVCRYALSADSFCSRYDLGPIRFGPIRFVPMCFIPVCFVPVRLSTYLYIYIYVCVYNVFLSIIDPISWSLSVSYLHICNIMKHIYWFLAMVRPCQNYAPLMHSVRPFEFGQFIQAEAQFWVYAPPSWQAFVRVKCCKNAPFIIYIQFQA